MHAYEAKGADRENRTLVFRLEACNSTIELYPQKVDPIGFEPICYLPCKGSDHSKQSQDPNLVESKTLLRLFLYVWF